MESRWTRNTGKIFSIVLGAWWIIILKRELLLFLSNHDIIWIVSTFNWEAGGNKRQKGAFKSELWEALREELWSIQKWRMTKNMECGRVTCGSKVSRKRKEESKWSVQSPCRAWQWQRDMAGGVDGPLGGVQRQVTISAKFNISGTSRRKSDETPWAKVFISCSTRCQEEVTTSMSFLVSLPLFSLSSLPRKVNWSELVGCNKSASTLLNWIKSPYQKIYHWGVWTLSFPSEIVGNSLPPYVCLLKPKSSRWVCAAGSSKIWIRLCGGASGREGWQVHLVICLTKFFHLDFISNTSPNCLAQGYARTV